jgi:multidrug efflux pump subunit AcrA (membrane-fusion protein)
VKNRFVRACAALILVLGLTSLGWCARGWWQPPSSASIASASGTATAKVVRGTIEQTVRARGTVKPAPNALVRIGFPMPKDVSRRIRTLRVVEGDAVKTGTLLGELDTSDLAATLQQLRGDAAVVQARLEALRTLQPQEIHLAETVRDQASSQADLAVSNLERGAALRAKALLPEQEYDALASEAKVARARLANAEAGLNQVKTRFTTDIATLEAQLNQARASIRNTEVQIEWSTLRTPFDGIVFAVHQRAGELASNQPSSPVLTLLKANQLQVQLYIDETDFGKVRTGQDVVLQTEAHPGERLMGTMIRLLPQPILQENVVYYLALVDVQEAHRGLLRAEMTTLAFVQTGGGDQVLWVPAAALRSRPDGWYVRRVTATGSVDTPVQIGMRTEGQVEIRSGIAEGTEVLLER